MTGPGSRGAAWRRALPLALVLGALPAHAQTLDLLVQPGLGPVSSGPGSQWLARYLAQASGYAVRPRTHANVLAHWRAVLAASGPVLILDEAHFVDARSGAGGHTPIARLPGLVGHSIVTAPGTLLLDLDELEGRTLAAPPAPALATLQVMALFPDAVRRPRLRDARGLERALGWLRSGQVDAALVTPGALDALTDLNVLLDAEGAPAPGLTASAEVPVSAREAMRAALLEAGSRADGAALLDVLAIARFEPVEVETYEGYAALLRGTWRGAPP